MERVMRIHGQSRLSRAACSGEVGCKTSLGETLIWPTASTLRNFLNFIPQSTELVTAALLLKVNMAAAVGDIYEYVGHSIHMTWPTIPY